VTKADADAPALIPHLNSRIRLQIRLSVPRVEGMPFAQVHLEQFKTVSFQSAGPSGLQTRFHILDISACRAMPQSSRLAGWSIGSLHRWHSNQRLRKPNDLT
jgi:hypothetical protein